MQFFLKKSVNSWFKIIALKALKLIKKFLGFCCRDFAKLILLQERGNYKSLRSKLNLDETHNSHKKCCKKSPKY